MIKYSRGAIDPLSLTIIGATLVLLTALFVAEEDEDACEGSVCVWCKDVDMRCFPIHTDQGAF